MKTNLLIFAMTSVAIAAAAGMGVIAENRIGIVSRVSSQPADEPLAIEFASLFEFAAIEQFADAHEHILVNLATDATTLATDARQWLSESYLDANDVQQGVENMLLEIIGGKDAFMLDTVSLPIISGANYGKFAAMRGGVVESEDVNRIVTTYAVTALDGFMRFLSDLPLSSPEELPPEELPPEELSSPEWPEDGKRQLDEWANELGL